MELQINVPLTSTNGLTVPQDSVVILQEIFPFAKFKKELDENENEVIVPIRELHFNMNLYKSKADFLAEESRIEGGIKEFNFGYVRTLTEAEYAELNDVGAMVKVLTWCKDYIVEALGGDETKVSLIDIYA